MSRAVGAGTALSSMSAAVSTSTPVGVPAASRRMRPPGGSFDAAVMPAVARPRTLVSTAWPSTRRSTTGWSGTAFESAAWLGNAFSGDRFWSHPLPDTQVPDGTVGRGLSHPLHHLGEARRVTQVHLLKRCADADKVPVALGETRVEVGCGFLHHLGRSLSPRAGVVRHNERHDAAALDCDLEPLDARRRVHPTADQQPVAARRVRARGSQNHHERSHHQEAWRHEM